MDVSLFHRFQTWINELGFELGETLDGYLAAGSVMAVVVVFAAGVLTSLTPCVYPVIPVTVSVKLKLVDWGASRRRLLPV